MKVVHSWLKDYLGDITFSPEEIRDLLTFHSFEVESLEEVGEEMVLDVDVLPNRASDCLCHFGIAREIAAITKVDLNNDPLVSPPPTLVLSEELAITDQPADLCSRFIVALIVGLTIKPSPDWLQQRLLALGQRPINNVVDATNYVMLSLGQPIHAYDASKLTRSEAGQIKLGVRLAKAGECMVTLTGDEYELDPEVPVIVDGNSDTAVSLAGVKGGQPAAVTDQTTEIVLEIANFDPQLVRRSSASLKLHTDASKRYEHSVLPELPPYALQGVIDLLQLSCPDLKFVGCIDNDLRSEESKITKPVTFSLQQLEVFTGLQPTTNQVKDVFHRLGIACTKDDVNPNEFTVIAPWHRPDLQIPEDFVEEFARLNGYEQIKSIAPSKLPIKEINVRYYYSEQVRDVLIKLGFTEVITSSFRSKDEVKLANALASDKGYLRSNIADNLKTVLANNINHTDLLGLADVRVFEIGTVFSFIEGELSEHTALAVGIGLKSGKVASLLEEVLKTIADKLGTKIDWKIEAGVAETNFSQVFSSLPVPATYGPTTKTKSVQYQPFSIYPAISRDIAMWVDLDTQTGEIEELLNQHAGELRVRTTLVDTYRQEQKISYAFRLVFQAFDRTLTDQEVNDVMDRVYQAVNDAGWQAR